ncbi:hypothetical protein [Aureliella helgolandensis]|nr:hypothetical protein [Aureliella helgolandensis]
MKIFSPASLLLLALTVGCGGPGSVEVETSASGVKELIRSNLTTASETGEAGSAIMVIGMDIDKLAAEDPTLAAELKKSFSELEKANTPAKVKAKAKEMLGKL